MTDKQVIPTSKELHDTSIILYRTDAQCTYTVKMETGTKERGPGGSMS